MFEFLNKHLPRFLPSQEFLLCHFGKVTYNVMLGTGQEQITLVMG